MKHPEIGPDDRENSKLYFVANLIQELVPEYDIKQSDPLIAAEKGVGNCVAKAAISAVMLERANFVGSTPALAWNKNTHPKHGDDMFGKPRILNGHAYLLVSDTEPPYEISGISYNPGVITSNPWEIFKFNDDGTFAEVNDENNIVATEAGETVGYVISDWHTGGRTYQEALGIEDSIYHLTTREKLASNIVNLLVKRDVISSFEI